MNRRIFFSLAVPASLLIVAACCSLGFAQSSLNQPPKNPATVDANDTDEKQSFLFGSMEDEMKAKRRIKLEQKQYQENLNRAREADKLSSELKNTYTEKKSFSREDTKKLERLEKLTKRIRSEAGGSDEDESLDNPPNELQLALSRLAQVTESLRKVVEKTPRQVISATVIQQANVVLQLVRITRNLFH